MLAKGVSLPWEYSLPEEGRKLPPEPGQLPHASLAASVSASLMSAGCSGIFPPQAGNPLWWWGMQFVFKTKLILLLHEKEGLLMNHPEAGNVTPCQWEMNFQQSPGKSCSKNWGLNLKMGTKPPHPHLPWCVNVLFQLDPQPCAGAEYMDPGQ